MNFLSSLGIGLTAPIWMAALPIALAAVVYAYLKRGKGKQVDVGTVLLLKALKRPAFSRKKFRPPLRFYLEVLLLLLMILGAAGLYNRGAGRRVALLIDNSFSMAKINPTESVGTDLLSIAKRDAASFLHSLSNESRVALFVASPRLMPLTDGLVYADQAESLLSRVELAYAGDALEASIQKLATDPAYDRVEVYSDRPGDSSSESSRIGVHLSGFDDAQAAKQNVAIAKVSMRQQARDRVVEVTLAPFLTGPLQRRVNLDEVEADGRAIKLTHIADKSITLNGTQKVSLEFPSIPNTLRTFRVSLDSGNGSMSRPVDSIRQDDVAWYSLEARNGKILLVSQFSPKELALNQIKFADFAHVLPENYQSSLSEINKSGYLAAIFHRYIPPELPQINSLFINPVSSTSYFAVSDEMDNPGVTRWLDTHPVLSYLNMPSFKLLKSRIFKVPAWGEELISSTDGCIAFGGENNQHKYVALGFEVLPFDGSKSPLISILTLNIIKHLSNLGANLGYQEIGAPLPLAEDSAEAFYLDGETIFTSGSQVSAKSLIPAHPGMVALSSKLGTISLSAFDYFSERESNTLSPNPIHFEAQIDSNSERSENSILAASISVLTVCLLLVEILLTSLLALRGIKDGVSQ